MGSSDYCLSLVPTGDCSFSPRYRYEQLINRIHSQIPKMTSDGTRLQMIVCSATLHDFAVKKLAEKIMHFPTWVDLKVWYSFCHFTVGYSWQHYCFRSGPRQRARHSPPRRGSGRPQGGPVVGHQPPREHD